MKILLFLILKCFIYSKTTGDRIHHTEIRDVFLTQIEAEEINIDVFSKESCFRIKRELSTNELLKFEPEKVVRSPRRKRAVLENQNKIFFRRRKKKLFRKSKIRKSLLRRGKFTTATPYRHMKKYARGKGKLVKPPGLKYRKRYRFNRFKKTQDVALGVGADGRAPAKRSPPKKRPPIHIRDYLRGRATRKAFRGRVGERKLRGEEGERKRGGGLGGKRQKGATGGRFATKKLKGDYYDEGSDYSSDEVGEDSYSLPKQTKMRKQQGTFKRITNTYPRGNITKRKTVTKSLKTDTEFEYSSEDNTLLLSDEEQLTDISSEIEALRSEISDERPKHSKNASSSEYDQYSYAEDDSAIVQGEVVSSNDKSLKHTSRSKKTTVLGKVNYDQYDIEKLDASMKRHFKKKKSKARGRESSEYDDPFEDLDAGYKDETYYESISAAKSSKQTAKKSKTKLEKKQTKSKPKSKKVQVKVKLKSSDKLKSMKDSDESDSYDETDEYHDDGEPKVVQESEAELDQYALGPDPDDGSNEEYYSDEYSTYEETSTPKRRIPTWKMTQSSNSKQETLYEEYTDDDDGQKPKSKPDSKSNKVIKTLSQKITSLPSKTSHETSTYESEEYDSEEYSQSDSSDTNKLKKGISKLKKIPKKDSKTQSEKVSLKTKHSLKKGHDTSTYECDQYDTENEYSQSESFHSDKSSSPSKVKPASRKSQQTLDYEPEILSEEQTDLDTSYEHQSDKSIRKKNSPKSCSKPKKVTPPRKNSSKKDLDTSTYELDEYHSSYSDQGENKKIFKQITKFEVKHDKKITEKKDVKKNKKSEKSHETLMNESDKYDTDYYSDHYSNNDKELKNSKIKDLKISTSQKPKQKTSSLDISKTKKVLKSSHLEKTTPKKGIDIGSHSDNKIIQREKHLPKQRTEKSSLKTTKEKYTTDKIIEKSYGESEYDSEVTSYEHSSKEIDHRKRDFPNNCSSHVKDIPNTVHKKSKEMSYDELEQLDATVNHKNKFFDTKDWLGSHRDETESTIPSLSRTVLKIKRTKKGYTTLPTKGFDSAEALKKISSKAAAITKKHVFVYNTKKKAYELVRADLLQPISPSKPQPTVRQSIIRSRSTLTTSSQTLTTHSETKNPEITFNLAKKTLKKHIIYRKTTSKLETNVSKSKPKTSIKKDRTKT